MVPSHRSLRLALVLHIHTLMVRCRLHKKLPWAYKCISRGQIFQPWLRLPQKANSENFEQIMPPIHTGNATTVLLIAALGRSVQRLLDSRESDDSVVLERADVRV